MEYKPFKTDKIYHETNNLKDIISQIKSESLVQRKKLPDGQERLRFDKKAAGDMDNIDLLKRLERLEQAVQVLTKDKKIKKDETKKKIYEILSNKSEDVNLFFKLEQFPKNRLNSP